MKHYETLKMPLNIEQNMRKSPYMTTARTIFGLAVVVVYIVSFIYIMINMFFKSDTRNIFGGLFWLIVCTYVFLLILRFIVLREKYLKGIYKTIRENENNNLSTILKIYNYEVHENVPVFYLSNGYCVIGIKLNNGAVVGYDSKYEVYQHEEAIADTIKEINQRFLGCFQANIMETIGVDKRWERFLSGLHTCKIDIIKLLVASIAEYNMQSKIYESHDYFYIYDNPLRRPISKIVYDSRYIAQEFLKAKYKSYNFVYMEDLREDFHSIFGITCNFEKTLKYDVNLEDAEQMVRVLEVYKDGERIKMESSFKEDIDTKKERKRK